MREKLKEMLSLQSSLNDYTGGPDWRSGITNKGREIDWYLCISQEAGEFIDSFNWKHWKSINALNDIDNAKIELVDIWHFIMSQYLIDNSEDEVEVFKEYLSLYSEMAEVEYNTNVAIDAGKRIQFSANEMILPDCVNNFFRACGVIGLTFDELYTLYIGKNALNQFRQNNGYIEGTYRKEWNGVEDNVVLTKIIEENDDISFDNLLEHLANEYSKVSK
jgi:hypothetical protein